MMHQTKDILTVEQVEAHYDLQSKQLDAHYRLQEIIEQLKDLGNEAAEIMREFFPSSYMTGEAYGAFSLGASSNRHNTTLSSLVKNIDPYEFD
jgi:hypothetical protein